MNDLGDYLRKYTVDTALVVVMLGGLFAGLFGAANWNSHIRPQYPHKSSLISEAEFDRRI